MPTSHLRLKETGDGSRNRVLLVDDDPALLALMASAFASAGYLTQAADNGRKALALLQGQRFDLVVTDIVMPDVEGIGTILQIKSKAHPPKVIAISGHGHGGRRDYLSWAKHLGADEVLAKPFRMTAILALSKDVIARNSSNFRTVGGRDAHSFG